MSASDDRRTQVIRAGVAVARLRLRRAIARRHLWLTLGAVVAPLAPAVAFVVAVVASRAMGYPLLGLLLFDDSNLGFVLLPFTLAMLVMVIPPLMVGLIIAHLLWGTVGLVIAAAVGGWLALRVLPRALRRASLRRRAEEILLREGELPAAWVKSSAHRRVRDEMNARDDDIGVTHEGRLIPKDLSSPPESCPRCAAPLMIPGAGLRRCGNCGFERYDELPNPGRALRSARQVFVDARPRHEPAAPGEAAHDAAAQAEDVFLPVRRRELWRQMLEGTGGRMLRRRRRVVIYAVLMTLCGLLIGAQILFLGADPDESSLVTLPFYVAGVPAMICAFELPVLSYQYFDLRFRRFGAGARDYDQALLGEIVRAVAYKGRATKDEIAAHLGIRRPDLDAVLVSVGRNGGAPFYHDRVHDELIGLQAYEAGSNQCLACGGTLEAAERGRMQCAHCGSEALGPLFAETAAA